MKINTLDAIKKDYDDSKDRMFEMLASWLKRESAHLIVPSWNKLIRAVSNSVGIAEAETIAENFVCTHV